MNQDSFFGDSMVRTLGVDVFFDVELAEVREINAHLPFADPIAPGVEYPLRGWVKYFTRDIGSYREHDRRRRALDRLHRYAQKNGLLP